jgi:hypothetical protein
MSQKTLKLQINFTDDMCIKSVFTLENTTGEPSNQKFLQQVALALYYAYKDNKEAIEVQDLLDELDINTEDTKNL